LGGEPWGRLKCGGDHIPGRATGHPGAERTSRNTSRRMQSTATGDSCFLDTRTWYRRGGRAVRTTRMPQTRQPHFRANQTTLTTKTWRRARLAEPTHAFGRLETTMAAIRPPVGKMSLPSCTRFATLSCFNFRSDHKYARLQILRFGEKLSSGVTVLLKLEHYLYHGTTV
jgi:hypothetical protein